jgi:CheY-like chemotaxis protein
VSVANSTTDNLLRAGKDKIDLIVTGTFMECEHGFEIVAALAKASGCVPIVALAGARGLMSDKRSSESASLMGLNVNIVRNFVRADLREAISNALQRPGCHIASSVMRSC